MEYGAMRRLLKRAIAKGAERRSATCWEWDIAGRCEAPVTREMWSRPSSHSQALAERRKRREVWAGEQAAKLLVHDPDDMEWEPPPIEPKGFPRVIKGGPGQQHLLQLRMHVRCRKCERCRAMKRADWAQRAEAEFQQAQRTWFGTLTFNDIQYFRTLTIARKRARARSLDWDTLNPDVQFSMHAAAAYAEHVQKFWKRVRKATGSKGIRYLAVAEAGSTGGRLHFHVLVHEALGSAPLRYRALRDQWRGQGIGIDEFQLIDPNDGRRGVRYVTKYVAKGQEARVRASGRYGKRPLVIVKRENSGEQRNEASAPTHPRGTASETSSAAASSEGGIQEEKQHAVSG